MKENKKTQLQRAEKLLEIITKIKLSAEELRLVNEGYGNEAACEEMIQEMTKRSAEFIILLNIINSVAKNGEDQHRVLSC